MRTITIRSIGLSGVVAAATIAGVLVVPVGASLSTVSPTLDGHTSLPSWYRDGTGLQLTLCDDGSANCVGVTPAAEASGDPAAEIFYNRGVATLTASGAKITEVVSLQAGNTADGKRAVFQRIRSRIVGGRPNASYTVIEPFGTQTIATDGTGKGTTTQDVGCPVTAGAPDCDFGSALGSGFSSPDGTVGPFVQWDAGAPAGYVGDGVTAHTFTGSPNGNNFFRITGPGLPGATATTPGTISTSTAVITGKIMATGPVFSASPDPLSFGSQQVGTPSTTKTVRVSNAGGADMTISDVAASGDYSIVTTTCSGAVAPGAICTVDVSFAPTAAGTRSGTLTFTDDATGAPHTVGLTGTGIVPAPVASLPSSVPFGTQNINTQSVVKTVTVKNTGTADLTIDSAIVGGVNGADFAKGTDGCSLTTVAAGASCSIDLTFMPAATGSRSGTLTITDNAAGSPHTVTLSGTGFDPAAPPAVTFTPSSVTFPATRLGLTSAAQTVTVSNSGSGDLVISGVQVTGANAGDFAIASSTCAGTVHGGASCSVRVTFKPAAIGTRTGSLTIADNAAGGSQSASLTGTGRTGGGKG